MSADTTESRVLRERRGAIEVLWLHRPARRNALDSAMVAQLRHCLLAAGADVSVGAVVLTGTVPGFCSGSDLKELATLTVEEAVRHEGEAAALATDVTRLDVPVVAAVEGFAVGGGFLLATTCDLVVTSWACRWQLPEVGLGWVPPWGITSLTRRAGIGATRRLLWEGRPLTGRGAIALGVADEATAAGAVLRRALATAGRLCHQPRQAVASAKGALEIAMAAEADSCDRAALRGFARDLRSAAARRTLARYRGREG